MITENCINDIKQAAQIEDVIGELVPLKRSGSSLIGTCPFCDKEKKFSVSKSKDIWGCWSCGEKGAGSISFIMKVKTNGDYVNAIKYLASKYNIQLEYTQETIPLEPKKQNPPKQKKVSFRDQQLAESGLTDADQKYTKHSLDGDLKIEIDRYQSGTRNDRWEIVDGDDMVMHYMDLNGLPMMYHRKGTSKDYPLIRIRWANPGLHLDKEGKSMKYQSPYDSGSRIWINQKLRDKYQNGSRIKTLFIQEGEKKADKATKHGIISVGIMGIHNLANNKQLPHEFELIIKKCNVENIVFIVDSDYLDISDNTTNAIDQRPRSFLSAIINFRKYFYALNTSGINLNIYFGYINAAFGEKGIDDLLTKKLAGNEKELVEDIEKTMLLPDGKGNYLNIHNITSYNEYKIKAEFFHMETNETFAKFHYEKLKDRKVFLIGREKFKFSNKEEFPDKPEGSLVLAQPLSHDEEFWDETNTKRGGQNQLVTTFKYVESIMFLQNRHFGRYATDEEGEFNFIKVDDNIVRVVKPGQIRDYLMDFTRNALQKKNVLEMLFKGAKMYLSDNLNNLFYIKPNFHKCDKGIQYLYFDKTFWKITSEGVEEKPIMELNGHVWKDKIKEFPARLSKQLVKVAKNDKGGYKLEFPAGIDEAKKCMFFNYLINTSNFYWRKTHEGLFKIKKPATDKLALNDLEREDMLLHFISKCCAFGFMLHEHFDANRAKAVIAMDGKLSEVGSSNGRSGKSLFSSALGKMLPMVTLQGKQKDLTEDKFMLDGVTERTRIVNVDDARVNLDFEAFFSMIGGSWKVNPKGAKAFELPRETSPKIIISTNHAINGDGSSFRDRQYLIAFSDYYNEEYRPFEFEGVLFFDEWDGDQWNLFYNFAANCIQIYFEHGLVNAPLDKLEQRRLRQQMGESFVEWAESFYDPENIGEMGKNNLNMPLDRKMLLDKFYEMFPEQKKYIDTRHFKQKIKSYCKYKNYIFNPGKEDKQTGKPYGGDDKRNSVEFFTVHTRDDEK